MASKKRHVKNIKKNAKSKNGSGAAAPSSDSARTGKTFLDLPAEIRNDIYELAVQDAPAARLKPPYRHFGRKPHVMTIDSPLVYVNKQVSTEYLKVARARTLHIEPSVHDFNFEHVMSFFDQVRENGAKYAGRCGEDEPLHIVWITLSAYDAAFRDIENGKNTCFRDFVKRLANLNEIETKIRLMYAWVPEFPGIRIMSVTKNNDYCLGHKEKVSESDSSRVCDHEDSTGCVRLREQIPFMLSNIPKDQPGYP